MIVAPYVGAWIEITLQIDGTYKLRRTLRGCVDWNSGTWQENIAKSSRTLRGCVDWNLNSKDNGYIANVAPYVGAWIETDLGRTHIIPR